MKKAKEDLLKTIFMFGVDSAPVKVPIPSKEFKPFGAIEGDSIKGVNSLIIYKTPKGKFPRHIHKEKESGFVIEGSLIYKTHKGKFHLKEGDTFEIDKEVPHEFEFLEGTTIALKYTPNFGENWEAQID